MSTSSWPAFTAWPTLIFTAVTGPEQFPAPTAVVVVDATLPDAVAVACTEARLAATVRELTALAGFAVAVTVA
jgi:hypothetical protein